MTVHIVIPSYNPDESLCMAVEAALGQSHTDVLVTVIDDCSSTDPWPLIKDLATDTRLRYVRLATNGGPSNVRNLGLLLSNRTSYVTFHDDDDVPLPSKIERQLEALSAPKSIDTLRKQTIDRDNSDTYEVAVNKVIRKEVDGSTQVSGEMIYLLRDIHPNAYSHFGVAGRKYSLHFVSSLFDKDVFKRLGGFYDSLYLYEDNELAARTLLGGANFTFIDQQLYEFNKTDSSLTYQKNDSDNDTITAIFRDIESMKHDANTLSRREFIQKHCRPIQKISAIEYTYNLSLDDLDDQIPASDDVRQLTREALK